MARHPRFTFKMLRTLFVAAILALTTQSQTPRPEASRTLSPEVAADRHVTFRLAAPKAVEVSFFGDWMPPNQPKPMVRDTDGVWSITVGPMEPGVYIYNFNLDGLPIADPVNPKIKLRARTSASLLEVPAPVNAPALWEPRDVPHGTIEIVNHKSAALGGEVRQAWIYKPPGYDRSHRHYPVLYLLHGSNDTAAGWSMAGRVNFMMDNLLATQKAKEMVIVMPFGHAVPFDSPREIQDTNTKMFEQYLLNDLKPLVEHNYRVDKNRNDRAIVGLSMGGGQSLNIGLAHLDLFSVVGAFSCGKPRGFETNFASLLAHPKETNKKLKLLWIGCGRQDGAFKATEELAGVLQTNQIQHTFHPTEGHHNFAVWRDYFAEVAPQLFR